MKRLTHFIKNLVINKLYPEALKASTSLHDLRLTEKIYSLFTKSGFRLDIFIGSSLIDYFSKLGRLHHAHNLLVEMPETDTVVWNTLILGYARVQQTEPAFHLFNSMRYSCLSPDAFSLSSLIKASEFGLYNEIAHGVALKMGFTSNAFVISGLVRNYSKVGDIVSAEKCFNDCLVFDIVVCTTMVSGYSLNEKFEMAQRLFMEMRMIGNFCNQFTLSSVLGALSDIREGGKTHCLSIKMGFLEFNSTSLSNAIMSMYDRCGSKSDVIKLFDEIADPDLVSWTVRIGAAHDGEEAVKLFQSLFSRYININEYTIINVFSAIENSRLLSPGKQIQALSYKLGYLLMVSVSNALISIYGRCQCTEEARMVFDEILSRDCVSWNALISAYADNGLFGLTLSMFSEMRRSLLKPTKYTLACILEVISNSETPKHTNEIHAHLIKSGFMSDDSMLTCLIRAHGKCNEIEKSRHLFSEIHELNVVHVNAMLASCLHLCHHEDALKLFQDIWDSEVRVDSVTFSMVVKACGALTTLEQVKLLHSLTLKCGIDTDDFVGSALVDVYCKCGSIDYAEKVFYDLPRENLAACNAMIMGYAQHGYNCKVFELFDEMTMLDMSVDEISYLGVLYSCCHSGLVKEAFSIINSMFKHHNLKPQLEHYACLVDLLGRVGNLEEAKRTIEEMPIAPDAQIWQILLSACHVHGNLELGNIVSGKLLELQPGSDATYVVLSNLYASAGGWDEVGRVRRVMKEKTITKEPGASWIQVKGVLHSFTASDMSHQDSSEIHLKLHQLNKQLITAGKDALLFMQTRMATMCVQPGLTALVNSTLFPKRNQARTMSYTIGFKKLVYKSSFRKKRPIMSALNDEVRTSRVSPSDHAIVQFYDYINEKNLNKIDEFISDDCCFEDYSFLEPFVGKKEVLGFFSELTKCMGKNVKFVIQSVCQQEDQLSVAITWCLEWKGKLIPFTRGCAFYKCSRQDGRLVIKRGQSMVEWPIKPGALVLTLLKLVMYLFDEFPAITEKFLQRPHVIVQFLLRVYNIFLEPFVEPVLACYINIWKFVAQLLVYMINVMFHISMIISNKRKK